MTLIPLESALNILDISYNGFWKARARGRFRDVQVIQYVKGGRYKAVKESLDKQIKESTVSMGGA